MPKCPSVRKLTGHVSQPTLAHLAECGQMEELGQRAGACVGIKPNPYPGIWCHQLQPLPQKRSRYPRTL